MATTRSEGQTDSLVGTSIDESDLSRWISSRSSAISFWESASTDLSGSLCMFLIIGMHTNSNMAPHTSAGRYVASVLKMTS
jgi:hypothetical protein